MTKHFIKSLKVSVIRFELLADQNVLVGSGFLEIWVVVQLVEHVGLFIIVCGQYDVDDDVFDDLDSELPNSEYFRGIPLTVSSRLSSALISSVSQTSWQAEHASR